MAKYVIDKDTLTDVAEKIRYHNGNTEKITPEDIPDKIDLIAETKMSQGKKEAYDEFWDAYQNYGKRTHHYNGYSGYGWNETNFKPKYDIKPTGNAYGIFMYSRISGDLVEIADKQGIEIDFSNATSLQYAFATTLFTHIGVIDASKCTTLIRAFEGNEFLKTIDKIILNDEGTTNLSTAFNSCSLLEEVRFEGCIATNGINFGASKLLSHDSLISIITALKNRSGENTAYTCTLGDANLEKLTADEIKTATDKGWTLL